MQEGEGFTDWASVWNNTFAGNVVSHIRVGVRQSEGQRPVGWRVCCSPHMPKEGICGPPVGANDLHSSAERRSKAGGVEGVLFPTHAKRRHMWATSGRGSTERGSKGRKLYRDPETTFRA